MATIMLEFRLCCSGQGYVQLQTKVETGFLPQKHQEVFGLGFENYSNTWTVEEVYYLGSHGTVSPRTLSPTVRLSDYQAGSVDDAKEDLGYFLNNEWEAHDFYGPLLENLNPGTYSRLLAEPPTQ